MKKLLSPEAMVRKLSDTVRRFPLAVVCIAVAAVLALLAVHGFDEAINYRWWPILWFGLTSSVAVTLALEERWPRTKTLIAGLAVAVLWGVRCLFFPADPDEIFGWLAVACFIVFAPLYVLAGVPSGALKRDGDLRPEPVLKVLALYILGSILAVYAVILYLYLAKIVITWELPNGWVSWLVTALGAGGLAMTLLLYPHRMRSGNRIVEFLSRWTGVIIAPLLILMTVGIMRRVSDYGWTPNRAYMLLLNLWFYGIYAWLFIVRGRRVKWILISAVIVALISSVGPWSLARIEPDPDADRWLPAAAEENGQWFASDSTFTENTPYLLADGYDGFARIYWHGGDNETNNRFSFSREGDVLVISLHDGEVEANTVEGGGRVVREFRVSLQQATVSREIRGEGFMLLVNDCYGTRYQAPDSLCVSFLEGFMFYKTPGLE